MIICQVHLIIDAEVEGEWLRCMKIKHVPDVIATGLVRSFRQLLILGFFFLFFLPLYAQETGYQRIDNISYYSKRISKSDSYIQSRCKLDIYVPKNRKGFSTIVWFHGGGLTSGEKYIPSELEDKGVGVVAVNYRMHPKVKAPAYIEDAAAAVAWVFNKIQEYGGDSTKIYLSGHSAGGYLASMVGLDKSYLAKYDINADRIAGLIPLSGHTITHFTIRKEMGISGTQPIIDKYAPLFHVRSEAPPLLLITGDRALELLGRYEENAYLMRMMKVIGHQETRLMELDGYDHDMTAPSFRLILQEIKRIEGK